MELNIRTSDSFGDSTNEKVSCKKETNDKGTMYSYETELGQCKMFLFEDKLQIMRRGQVKSNQILKLNEATKFHYKTQYMDRVFTLKTEKLEVKEKKIEVIYTIFDGDQEVNKINLEIIEG